MVYIIIGWSIIVLLVAKDIHVYGLFQMPIFSQKIDAQ